jgi:hypothetical protein
MQTIIEICSHRILFNYFSRSKQAIPNDAEVEHVQNQLIDNNKAGELNMIVDIKGKEHEFKGWWSITT